MTQNTKNQDSVILSFSEIGRENLMSENNFENAEKEKFLAPDWIWSVFLNSVTGLGVATVLVLGWAFIKYRLRIIDW